MHSAVRHNAFVGSRESQEERDARAARLRQARARLYDDPTAAAEALRMSKPTYYGHENGSRGFASSAKRYAAFFKVRLAWLLHDEGDMDADRVELAIRELSPPHQSEVLNYIEFLKTKKSK